MSNTNLNLNIVVEEKMSMKKSNIICLYHIKVKEGILSIHEKENENFGIN